MLNEQIPKVLVYRLADSVQARLIGPVNRETIPVFQQRLEEVTGDGCFTLTLDLGAADYVDSDGIRWLQRLQMTRAGLGVELRLAVQERSRPERTLNLLQLDATFTIDRYPCESGDSVPITG